MMGRTLLYRYVATFMKLMLCVERDAAVNQTVPHVANHSRMLRAGLPVREACERSISEGVAHRVQVPQSG